MWTLNLDSVVFSGFAKLVVLTLGGGSHISPTHHPGLTPAGLGGEGGGSIRVNPRCLELVWCVLIAPQELKPELTQVMGPLPRQGPKACKPKGGIQDGTLTWGIGPPQVGFATLGPQP